MSFQSCNDDIYIACNITCIYFVFDSGMIKINKSKDNYMKYLQVAKDISSVSEIINYPGYFKLGYYLPTSDSEPENVKEDPSHSPHPSRDVKCSPSI